MIVRKFIEDKLLQKSRMSQENFDKIWQAKNGKARICDPRPSGGLSQLSHSGGGIFYHPSLTKKLRGLKIRGKKQAIALASQCLRLKAFRPLFI